MTDAEFLEILAKSKPSLNEAKSFLEDFQNICAKHGMQLRFPNDEGFCGGRCVLEKKNKLRQMKYSVCADAVYVVDFLISESAKKQVKSR